MFSQLLSSFAETDDPEVIKKRAKADATHDVSKRKWFGTGVGLAGVSLCCGTILLTIAGVGAYSSSSNSSSVYSGIAYSGALIIYVTPAVGMIAIHRHSPSPPAEKLLGKSPLYVSIYTDTYQSQARSVRRNMATLGCGLIYGVLAVLAMATLEL